MMKTPQSSGLGPPVRRRPQHAHRRTSRSHPPPGHDSSARQTGGHFTYLLFSMFWASFTPFEYPTASRARGVRFHASWCPHTCSDGKPRRRTHAALCHRLALPAGIGGRSLSQGPCPRALAASAPTVWLVDRDRHEPLSAPGRGRWQVNEHVSPWCPRAGCLALPRRRGAQAALPAPRSATGEWPNSHPNLPLPLTITLALALAPSP